MPNSPLPLTLFDTYQKQLFRLDPSQTLVPNTLKIYHCGITAYYYAHIGNLQSSWLADTVVKVAALAGWKVEFVENITDVGHLVGDGDDGQNVSNNEDKLEKGAKRENKKVSEIVDFYSQNYRSQAKKIGLDLPTGTFNPKATEYIQEQMILALELLKEGKAYLTEDGIYYDSRWEEKAKVQLNANLNSSSSNVLSQIIEIINKLQREKTDSNPFIIAIDGRGGSGKSTLAKEIANNFADTTVLECDDFFDFQNLTEKEYFWNKKRFLSEVLIPINKGEIAIYEGNLWQDHKWVGKAKKTLYPTKLIILEGLCTLQVDLSDYYDLKFWLDINVNRAMKRVEHRDLIEKKKEPDEWNNLWQKWLPIQDTYIVEQKPQEVADLIISTEKNSYEILGNHIK